MSPPIKWFRMSSLNEDLIDAASRGDLKKVKMLLNEGADVNTRDINGRTPLHYAAARGHLDTVKFLVDRGADVNTRNVDGWTPLHEAAAWGHLDVVEFLLDRGADVNAKNIYGWTPLHYAAAWGHLDIAKLLLDRGADINAKNGDGKTPLDLAKKKKYWDIVNFLEKAVENKLEASGTSVMATVVKSEGESSPILDLSKYLKNPQKNDKYLNELYRAMLIVKRRGEAAIREDELSSLIDSIKAALDKIGYDVHISKENSVTGSLELSEELMSVLGIGDGDFIIVNSILKLVARKGDLEYNSVRMHEEDAKVVIGPMIVRGKDKLEGMVLSFKKVEEKPVKFEDERDRIREYLRKLEELREKGEISESVYLALKREYESKMRD
jgi:ankyrin repeat protein